MERLTSSIVPPMGPLDAKLLFIGEAPGAEEDEALEPFKGGAGRLLNSCLKNVGINRSDCLITNIFSQRPPKNNVKYYYHGAQPTAEGQEHIEALREWLEQVRLEGGPKVICALGATAMKVLTGKKRINKWRGTVLPCTLVEDFLVYPTYHPSHVMRLQQEPRQALMGEKKRQQDNIMPVFLLDLQRIDYLSKVGKVPSLDRSYEINPTCEDVVSKLRSYSNTPVVACDIETIVTHAGPILWCIGFASNPLEGFVIPFLKERKFCWSSKEEAKILYEISRLFQNPLTQKVFHNASYDLGVLGRYYNLVCAPGSVEDTMLCHHASYPFMYKSLNMLTSLYTWEPYYKDERKISMTTGVSDEAEFIYNGKDCCVTAELWPIVKNIAKEEGTWKGYRRTMDQLGSRLTMEIRGVQIDKENKAKLQIEFDSKAVEAERLIKESFGDESDLGLSDINLKSSQQVNRLVYGYLGMPIQYHYKTKKPSTDKDSLNKLIRLFPDNQILKALLDHRKFTKLSKTYAAMKLGEDNRARTSYSLISTFRLNSSTSHFGEGGNLQNIPVRTEEGRMVRKLFVPDPGLVLLACDLAQAEAMVVAWLAEDIKQINDFLAGKDCHWENAKSIFSIPKSREYAKKELYKDPFTNQEHPLKFFRDLAKTIVHASNYLMGPKMLQTILVRQEVYLEDKVCKQMLLARKMKSPMIGNWQQKTIGILKSTRTLVTPKPFERKRVFRGRLDQSLFASGVAFVPQSTVGEILEEGIQKIHTEMGYVQPLLNVHDEVVVQLKKEDVPQAIKDIRKRLSIPLQIHGRELIIPCDFKTGPSWGDLEEINE